MPKPLFECAYASLQDLFDVSDHLEIPVNDCMIDTQNLCIDRNISDMFRAISSSAVLLSTSCLIFAAALMLMLACSTRFPIRCGC